MVVSAAGDAMLLFLVRAVFRPMSFVSACAAGVCVGDAFPGRVIPGMAFHAANRFFLGFGDSNPSMTDIEAC